MMSHLCSPVLEAAAAAVTAAAVVVTAAAAFTAGPMGTAIAASNASFCSCAYVKTERKKP